MAQYIQLFGELGIEDEQQSILHLLHVWNGTGLPASRHNHLLRQDPTRRTKGIQTICIVCYFRR